ncbi:MAG: PTS mannose transporter subunit IID [Synergistaceae bacterium]|jgi:dihydroxyacetone kinase phosphotransfer subunit|nr:PTS mannose transporter subunit IID [Synergistaceae bacterium]
MRDKRVGILVVSHSEDAARGIRDIAASMSGTKDGALIAGVGGNDAGGLGVSVEKIFDALAEMLTKTESVLIIPDLGSSVLSSRSAVELLPPEQVSSVMIADAPILEGAMVAAVEASVGRDLAQVADSASKARDLRKNEH